MRPSCRSQARRCDRLDRQLAAVLQVDLCRSGAPGDCATSDRAKIHPAGTLAELHARDDRRRCHSTPRPAVPTGSATRLRRRRPTSPCRQIPPLLQSERELVQVFAWSASRSADGPGIPSELSLTTLLINATGSIVPMQLSFTPMPQPRDPLADRLFQRRPRGHNRDRYQRLPFPSLRERN